MLAMPGERAAVLRKGDFDIRLEAANTATIARDREEQADVTMKFETVRAGLFLRYGLTERLEVGRRSRPPSVQGLWKVRFSGWNEARPGVSPPRKALRDTGYAFNVSNGGRTMFQGFGKCHRQAISHSMVSTSCCKETGTQPALSIRVAVKAPTGDTGQNSEAATRMPASVWPSTRPSRPAGSCTPT